MQQSEFKHTFASSPLKKRSCDVVTKIMVCELLRSCKTQLWSEKLQPVGAKYTLNLWHGVKNKRAPMQLQTKVSTSDKQSAGKWWVTNEPLCVWTGLRNDSRRREKKNGVCHRPVRSLFVLKENMKETWISVVFPALDFQLVFAITSFRCALLLQCGVG